LADANKEQILRDEAVTERLRTMSAAAEGKCFALSFLFRLLVILADILLSSFVVQVLPEYLHRLCNRVTILC
jgi:hypothetical protein